MSEWGCCKDSANERNVSSLTNCRVQPIFCKDSASEWNNKTKHAVFVFFIPEHSLSYLKIQYIIEIQIKKLYLWIQKTLVL